MKFNLIAAASAVAISLAGCASTYDDGMNDSASNGSATQASASAGATAGATASTSAEPPTITYVGGAEMSSDNTIVENAMNSPVHTKLVAAVKAAGLVETLSGEGPFTVFAPTDEAFSRVPEAVLSPLMMPENQAELRSILTYHVVPGALTAEDLGEMIDAGGGTATVKTVQGENLTLTEEQGFIKVTGMAGSSGYVRTADLIQSNGVVHSTNGVLLPTMQ